MQYAHTLIRLQGHESKSILMKDQENVCTPRAMSTTASDSNPDYDSNLRRRRLSLKGTERLKDTGRVRKPPTTLPTSRIAETIGRIAGLAWGVFSMQELTGLSDGDNASLLTKTLMYAAGSAITAVFTCLSSIFFLLLIILTAIDELHQLYFWCISINEAHLDYCNMEHVITDPLSELCSDEILYPNDLREPSEWRCNNSLYQLFFDIYVSILEHLRGKFCPKLTFPQYLAIRPPLTPISANDEMYRIDDDKTRLQLSMLFVVQNVEFERFKRALIRRWIQWEPKTRSIVVYSHGRWVWKALPADVFDVNKHVKHVTVNLAFKSVAEVVSELSTADMPLNLPQWELWFIDGLMAGGEKVNFVASKWNHVYADGVGVMSGIVNRLGDEVVSITGLPSHYKRHIPRWQQMLYYGYHALFAGMECVQFLLYASLGIPKYQGLLADSGYVSEAVTGVKHYSAPIMLRKSVMSRVAERIYDQAVQLYMTDEVKYTRAPTKPTMNDLLCYCLLNAVAQLKNSKRVEELVKIILHLDDGQRTNCPDHITHEENYLHIIIPMMCRTSMPEKMDNYTSLVPTRLPLPTPQWKTRNTHSNNYNNKAIVVDSIYRIKSQIDRVKRQNCRVTIFIILYMICKALPTQLSHWLHSKAYANLQFCSTNVAAPAIEARFCGRIVHGLFFWPAVTAGSTCGSSWISLGDEVQASVVVDEAEMRRAVEIAQRLSVERNAKLGEDGIAQFLIEFSDLLPRLMEEEMERLVALFPEDNLY